MVAAAAAAVLVVLVVEFRRGLRCLLEPMNHGGDGHDSKVQKINTKVSWGFGGGGSGGPR